MQVIMYVSGGGAEVKAVSGNVQIVPLPEGQKPLEKVALRDKKLEAHEIVKLQKTVSDKLKEKKAKK